MSQVVVSQQAPVRKAPILPILFGVLIGLGIAVLGIASVRSSWSGAIASDEHAQTTEGASSGVVHLHFGAGNLSLRALDASDAALARMQFDGPAEMRPERSYAVREGVGELRYSSRDPEQVLQNFPFIGRGRDHADLGVRLSPNVPMALDVVAGAADADIDLQRLRVSRLDLATGAAHTRVRTPEAAGVTTVKVKAGVGQLAITVPDGVAADIDLSMGIAERTIDQRFRPVGGGRYRSADYDTATNRVLMHIDLGIGDLSVR